MLPLDQYYFPLTVGGKEPSGGSAEIVTPIYAEGEGYVPNSGFVQYLKFNINLSTTETDLLIKNANLSFSDLGDGFIIYSILLAGASSVLIADYSQILGVESGNAYLIIDMSKEEYIYISDFIAQAFELGTSGWNPMNSSNIVNGIYNINSEAVSEADGIISGTENEKIINLVTAYGMVDTGKVEVLKELTGQYKIIEKKINLDIEQNTSYECDLLNDIDEENKKIALKVNINAINLPTSKFLERSLSKITIPNDITMIGKYALAYCSNLTEITIPENITYLGMGAFRGCTGLTSFTIPNSCYTLGEELFAYCSNLTKVIFESSFDYPYLPAQMFYLCSNLTEITIPESITVINQEAFCGCNSLTNITIPNKVKTIGDGAFRSCYSLTEITIPESVTYIYSNAFSNCKALQKVNILSNIETINERLFESCESLTEITIPESVKSLSAYCFAWCKSLTNITIPKNVSVMYEYPFSGCESLENVTVEAVTPPTCHGYIFSSYDKLQNIYVPAESVEAYKEASYWKYYSSYIKAIV